MSDKTYKSFYRFAKLPCTSEIAATVDRAAVELTDKLLQLDLASLPISDYSKKYFSRYLSDIQPKLEHYTYLFALAIGGHRLPPHKITFVDHGGGTGLLSLLARQAGVGTVVYNDIYDVSCRDARIIAEALALTADHYVNGDENGFLQFVRTAGIRPHVIMSSDVIEHIYDIEGFLDRFCTAFSDPCVLVMASSANAFNPRTRRLTMKHHMRQEHEDGKLQWGHKERDTLRSFLESRKEIITKHFSELKPDEIDSLARRTRGLMVGDILSRVDNYLKTKQLPAGLAHPTNTCDPFTGNWAEHLMDPYVLLERMQRHGFRGSVRAGYYSRCKRLSKRLLTGGGSTFSSRGPANWASKLHLIISSLRVISD